MTTAALIALALALASALGLLAGTRRALGRARGRADAERRRLDEAVADHEARLDATRDELAVERDLLDDERERRDGIERRVEVEARWNEELREQLRSLHAEKGTLGDTSDVRALVLHTARTLLGAEKGMLLARTDHDGDGHLDLVYAEGFEHDPEHSAVAQHFAAQVLARDETVRAADPGELELAERTPADDEIENLVAVPIYIHDRFRGVVVCANKRGGFDEYDDDVLLALGDHAGAALHNARLRGDVRGAYLATVRVLADAVEAKDRGLRGHANDVSAGVLAVADSLGIEPRGREQLIFASLLHDVGKLALSEGILLKPGPLTPEERALVEEHPRIGHRLVEQVPALRAIAPAVLHHHERWDGEGYPARLRGEEIPLEARLICVADAFSAMREERPYRDAKSLEDACEELKRCAGTQFDPTVVRHFVEEVLRRPPELVTGPLQRALADPELAARRPGGALLGDGAISAVDNLTLLYGHRFLHELAAAEAVRAELQGRPFAVLLVELTDLRARNADDGVCGGRRAADAARRRAPARGVPRGRDGGA